MYHAAAAAGSVHNKVTESVMLVNIRPGIHVSGSSSGSVCGRISSVTI